MIRKNVQEQNKKNAEFYGLDNQLNQTTEECGELIQAINKFKRSMGNGQPTTMAPSQTYKNLCEELVDVQIMIEQLAHLLKMPDEAKEQLYTEKIHRTQHRIQEATTNKKDGGCGVVEVVVIL